MLRLCCQAENRNDDRRNSNGTTAITQQTRLIKHFPHVQQELESYGGGLMNTVQSLGPLLLHLLSKFCTNFRDALDGKSPDISTTELCAFELLFACLTDK